MKRPKSEDVPNQGCGIFFLMVLTTFLLMSLPVLKTTYRGPERLRGICIDKK